ncbi:MAG: hypothetical protein ACK5Q5_08515 [Planctomycetaceae bacterium]
MTGEASETGESASRSESTPQRQPPDSGPAAAVARPADDPPFPALNSGPADQIWSDYFSQHRPKPQVVAREVDRLHREHHPEQVIALIEAAVINGQSQPWMYEVLAISMEMAGRPQAEIERVVLSFADFGTADFGTMMFSAAYLVRLERDAAGLKLYREASRMLPEQPEPYILGLRLARKLGDPAAVEWAVTGVLQHVWTKNYRQLHRDAENAAAELLQRLKKANDAAGIKQLQDGLSRARQRDLTVRLVWNGAGDLDLRVEEPSHSICSFEQTETAGGGVLVHDGYGPQAENCYEEYVCAQAMSGDYRFVVRHVWGDIVGSRATLTIIRHQGTPAEEVTTEAITLGPQEASIRIHLDDGRRKQIRIVAPQQVSAQLELPAKRTRPRVASRGGERAAADLARSRGQLAPFQIGSTGAVGYQPTVTIIPTGETFTAQAIVSPDRRYVRIGVSPTFSQLIDVVNFTFFGPAGQTGQSPGQPIGGAAGN